MVAFNRLHQCSSPPPAITTTGAIINQMRSSKSPTSLRTRFRVGRPVLADLLVGVPSDVQRIQARRLGTLEFSSGGDAQPRGTVPCGWCDRLVVHLTIRYWR